MSEDSNPESRLTLARTIEQRGSDIVNRWLARAEANVRGKEVSPAELRDAMPDYLRRIAEALRTTADTVEHGAAAAWADVAREHALTRVRLGFDVDELVREFILLRQVLFEVATEGGMLLDTTQAARVADLIDVAIAVVVKSYVESRDNAEQVTLHVYDNCPGLSTEELNVIFAPFERGRTRKPGTGLGLAIARQALHAQGGAIGADSAEERGCHFWITIPKQQRTG